MSKELREAVEWCLARDQRNGSLPQAYADRLKNALSQTTKDQTDEVNLSERDRRNPDLNGYLKRIERGSRLQANVMRDLLRTGGWEGSEKVADAFEDIADTALEALSSQPT